MKKELNRILVIKLRKLGDVINTTPAIRALRGKFPNAEIVFLTEPLGAQVYQYSVDINDVWLFNRKISVIDYLKLLQRIRKYRFDLVIDLYQHNKTKLLTYFSGAELKYGFVDRPGQQRTWAYNHGVFITPEDNKTRYSVLHNLKLLKPLSVATNNLEVNFPVDGKTVEFANEFVHHHGFNSKTIGICVQSERSIAQVPRQLLAEIANYLVGQGFRLYFIYGPNERELARPIYELIDKKSACIFDYVIPTVAQVRAILNSCYMYVGNDGGNKHLAVAAGIPTIGLFWADNPPLWTPPNQDKHAFIQTKDNAEAFDEFISLFSNLKTKTLAKS